jgi:hypothetical protein
MHDLVMMAIINSGKHMSHYLGGFIFRQVTLVYYLVEQLSSGAYFCYDEESFFILEVLIDLDNIRMIQIPQDINFIIQNLYLLFIHRLLFNHFHCSLFTSFDMDDSSNTSESTRAEFLSNSIKVDELSLSLPDKVLWLFKPMKSL